MKILNDKKIKAYKHICKLAEVPELLIEHPELIFSRIPTNEDINWAKTSIKEYEKNMKKEEMYKVSYKEIIDTDFYYCEEKKLVKEVDLFLSNTNLSKKQQNQLIKIVDNAFRVGTNHYTYRKVFI